MEKVYCIICGKYSKLNNTKISYIFKKTLVLSIICSKCDNEDKIIFKKEESIDILKIIGLIKPKEYIIISNKKSTEENISQELRLKNIDETRNISLKK